MYRRIAEDAIRNVFFHIRLVDPAMAGDWLSKNIRNRPLGMVTVNRYVHYIKTGQWMLNGEPIIIDPFGNMLDGQHRCSAIVRANIAVPICVIFGITNEAFKTLNQGKLRSGVDVLGITGQERCKTLSSALGWLNRYLMDCMTTSVHMSNIELLDLLKEHPGIKDSVSYITPRVIKGMHPPGLLAFLHYTCTEKHPEHHGFFEQILTGVNISEGTPQYILTRKLQLNRGEKSAFSKLETAAFIVKAWNAVVTRSQMRILRWLPSEGFPKIL